MSDDAKAERLNATYPSTLKKSLMRGRSVSGPSPTIEEIERIRATITPSESRDGENIHAPKATDNPSRRDKPKKVAGKADPTQSISIRLSPDEVSFLEAYAEKHRWLRAQAYRFILQDFIANERKKKS